MTKEKEKNQKEKEKENPIREKRTNLKKNSLYDELKCFFVSSAVFKSLRTSPIDIDLHLHQNIFFNSSNVP